MQAFDSDERFSFTDGKDLARREVVELQLPAADGPPGLVLAFRQTLASTYLFYQSLAWLGRSASDTLAALEPRRFARFPQGLPPGFDPKSLGALPAVAGRPRGR